MEETRKRKTIYIYIYIYIYIIMFVYSAGFGIVTVAVRCHCNVQIHATDRCNRIATATDPASATSLAAVTGPATLPGAQSAPVGATGRSWIAATAAAGATGRSWIAANAAGATGRSWIAAAAAAALAIATGQIHARCCSWPLQQPGSASQSCPTALVAGSTGGCWLVRHHRPLQVIMILDHVTQLCYLTLFLDSVT